MSGSWDETRLQYEERMKAAGFKIVHPKPNELQIDIDYDYQFNQFLQQVEVFERNWKRPNDGELHSSPVLKYEVHTSTSGDPQRRHVTVTLPFEVDHWQRIAWQAVFGSDPLREILSLFRALGGDTTPGIFVEHA